MGLLPELYLVIDVKPHSASASLLAVRAGEKIRILQTRRDFQVSRLKSHLLALPFMPTVILSVDPVLSFTNEVPVEIIRPKPNLPITPVELENSLSQVFTKISNEQRKYAAQELNVPELDSILVQSDAHSMTIDNRPVVSPIGQTGRVMGAMFSTAFTTRPIFEVWHPLFNSGREFYFTDALRSALFSLCGHRDEGRVLHNGPTYSYLLTRNDSAEGGRLSRARLDWGINELCEPLMDAYDMPLSAAYHAVLRYRDNLVSPSVAATFANLFAPVGKKYFRELRAAGLKSGEVYSNHLPPVGAAGRIKVKEIPLDEVVARRGLRVEDSTGLSPSETLSFIAPFVEFYYHKKVSPVNYWLKRRVHWLIPV